MFTYNNKVYGDAGHYVTDSKRAGFCLAYDEAEEYTEVQLTDEIEKMSDSLFKLSGKFYFNVYDKDNIKRDLIKLLYNNDEQIAIILNKDNSDYTLEVYNSMQEWRDYLERRRINREGGASMVCLLMSIRPFSLNLTENPTVLASSDRNPTKKN